MLCIVNKQKKTIHSNTFNEEKAVKFHTIYYKSDKYYTGTTICPESQHIPTRLNTAISPEVLSEPKCTPDTNNNLSVRLNCENCVYSHVNSFISA